MSKFENGFALIIILPFILFMMSLWDMYLWQDLQEMKFFWKKTYGPSSPSLFIKEEPCVLICRPNCVSVAIWRVGERYVTRPLMHNLCKKTETLKIDKLIVFDAM